jgi:CDP-diacylglycerol--glycerol-3-phosphate 3-phosphatidyltransferase/cardiolipin synthase
MRMALVPVFIVFYYLREGAEGDDSTRPGFAIAALAVFVAAALTDAADGHIARKRGLITNFGKLMDPLADKVLTMAAFACFVETGVMPAWILVVILAREFLITGLRGVAAANGVVIAAGLSGKLKTALQMSAIALFLLAAPLFAYGPTQEIGSVTEIAASLCLLAALAATVYSGAEYMWKGRKLLNMK